MHRKPTVSPHFINEKTEPQRISVMPIRALSGWCGGLIPKLLHWASSSQGPPLWLTKPNCEHSKASSSSIHRHRSHITQTQLNEIKVFWPFDALRRMPRFREPGWEGLATRIKLRYGVCRTKNSLSETFFSCGSFCICSLIWGGIRRLAGPWLCDLGQVTLVLFQTYHQKMNNSCNLSTPSLPAPHGEDQDRD